MPTIADHLRSPDVTLDDHTRTARISFGQSLAERHPIYLDVNYWILLRDAYRGCSNLETVELLSGLRSGVSKRKIFCPISEPLFVEILKQTDPDCRKLTALLIDELSQGAALVDEETRISTEIAHFIYTYTGRDNLYAIRDLIWVKLSYVMGIMHPTETRIDRDTERAIQKSFFDYMWDRPIAELIERIGNTKAPLIDLSFIATKLNAGTAAHSGELHSYQQAYSAEIRGVVDLFGGVAVDVTRRIALNRGIEIGPPSTEQRRAASNQWKNLFVAVMEKGKARDSLRTMHILATLHASLRWNKGQKFKGNDLYDFSHAACALAYCDVFLTEGRLRNMIRQNHVGLDRLYNCQVVADLSEAIEVVRSI